MLQPELLKVMLACYGSVIVLLLGVIAYTLRRFLEGYDSFKKEATDKLNDHETRISILEK